jgi:hypothetical protein
VALSADPRQHNRESITVGIVVTVVLHLLFVFARGSIFEIDTAPLPPPPADEVELQLPDPPEVGADEPERPRFVETNPDAPENEPDKTNNVSARNQQSANEKTPDTLSADRTPARDGKEIESNKIVSGELPVEVPSLPSTAENEPAPDVAPSDPSARDPFSGDADDQGDSPDGVRTSVAPAAENPQPVSEPVKGTQLDSPDTQPLVRATPAGSQRPLPAPRPRVVRTPPGPVQRQEPGVSQTGYIGIDARFSQFGEYQTRMVEAVSQRWHALCSSRAYGEHGTHVRLRFILTRDGNVRSMETLETTAQSVGALLCRTAIEQGQSFGPWTEEMVSELGVEDVIVFNFYYW